MLECPQPFSGCLNKHTRRMQIAPLALGTLLGLVLAAAQTEAAGFGTPPSSVAMGAPLAVTVAFHLDESGAVEPDCIAADVWVGDRRVQPFNVRTQVEPGAHPRERLIRIATTVSIDEPVVSMQLAAGCGTRITRRFTLFADPPMLAAAPVALAAPAYAEAQPAGNATGAVAQVSTAVQPTTETGAVVAKAQAQPVAEVPAQSAGQAPQATSAKRKRSVAARQPGRSLASASARPAGKPTDAAQQALASRPGKTKVTTVRPRLTLEAPESPAALSSAASAASAAQVAMLANQAALQAQSMAAAASAAAAAASATAQRIQALEAQVEGLIAGSRQQGADNQQLRRRLAETESGGQWKVWLTGLAALLLLTVLWLVWRLRRAQMLAKAYWWKVSQQDATHQEASQDAAVTALGEPQAGDEWTGREPMGLVTAPLAPVAGQELAAAATSSSAPGTSPAAPATRGMAPLAAPNPGVSTLAEPATLEPGWTTITPPRPVSAEELIDLEQQAEFFVVLGQDEAAIDLLVGHIRTSGGISPLPYLKLLEIYHRRGEQESYERTRARFNQRFNAYAPQWAGDVQGGQALDAYPGVLQPIQAAWSSPMDAMAELEALLFRKDGGQLFDLPAYRELLLLYSLARDLLDSSAQTVAPVDLLLPLDLAQPYAVRPLVKPVAMDDTQALGLEVSVLGSAEFLPIDFDLSQLGELNTDATRPAAFTELHAQLDSRLADLPELVTEPAGRSAGTRPTGGRAS